ncbi:putative rhamnosyl transferase [Marinovum sp.]|uniref:putative rhamnosyl transferase n=1 Tax=Marinovum sp. TaxID=2024839 RepID=UPI002B269521|nr:putative rhamnosyl transferase [Marinovum sp.]
MQVIGLCRFSYPALGGFQVEHDSVEDRIAYLYGAERMEERFRHFEAITLPGLKAQTDGDFTFLIVIGDQLPQPHLDRLHDLVADFPQARIVAQPPREHRPVMAEILNDARADLGHPCLQFRHDDDDAVGVTFVQRLREAAADCPGLLRDHRLVGFDFNRGYIARPDSGGLLAQETVTPYWGVALAMAVKPWARHTIMNFGHNRLNRFMPTVTFTHEPMFVRGHNDHNDSRQGEKVTKVKLRRLDAAGEQAFDQDFAISSDRVRAIFAGTPRLAP